MGKGSFWNTCFLFQAFSNIFVQLKWHIIGLTVVYGSFFIYCYMFLAGLSYRWLLNEFPNFLANGSRHFVSQVTGNLYIARTEAEDVGKYSCLATSHIAFTTKSVYSSFTPLIVTPGG